VPYRIELLRPGALPKTTSGKIQRALSRQLWLEGSLDRL
jgi:acyl-coenzyme A synthetase/AMP-(fatty) acid ligase